METTPKKPSWFRKKGKSLIGYAGTTIGFVFRVLIPFLFGMTFNAIFAFVFLGAWLAYSEKDLSSISTIILFGIFLGGFPFLYFWLARGHAMKRCLEYIYDSSDFITSKVIGLATEAVVRGDDAVDKSPQFVGKGIRGVGALIGTLDTKVPRAFRWTLSAFFRKIPFKQTFLEVGNEVPMDVQNLPLIKEKMVAKVDTYIKEELIGASLSWFWVLLFLNFIAMYASWYFIVGF